jgi:hypothetical protein
LYILQCMFENWYGGIKPLLIAQSKLVSYMSRKKRSNKAKVFLSWLCHTKKRKQLTRHAAMTKIRATISAKKEAFYNWMHRYSTKIKGVQLKAKTDSDNVHTIFLGWLQLTRTSTAGLLLAKLISSHHSRNLMQSFASWKYTTADDQTDTLRCEEIRAALMLHKMRRLFVAWNAYISEAGSRRIVHEEIVSHFAIRKAGRYLNAFKTACQLSRINKERDDVAELKYLENLMLKALLGWKSFVYRHIESHIRLEENEIVAIEHWRMELKRKTYVRWADEYKENQYRKTRSKAYEIFSSWKLYTRERALLRRYLKESNLSERYLHSSRESFPLVTNRSS